MRRSDLPARPLNERGHIANREDEGVLAQIKRFITAHQYSRFASWDGPDRPLNMVGFRRVEKDPLTGEEHTLFHILPEGWREMCRGFSPARAARLCQKQNACCPAATGNTSHRSACRRSAKRGLPPYLPHPQYLSAVSRVLKRWYRVGQVVHVELARVSASHLREFGLKSGTEWDRFC